MAENPEPWTDPRTPALAIVARGDQIRQVGRKFIVRSQSNPDKVYGVFLQEGKWLCGCDFHQRTLKDCIHIIAVRFRIDMRSAFPEAPPKVVEHPACDRCGGATIRNGERRNKSGAVARWLCKACGRQFTGRDGYHKRRSDPRTIALALDLYFRGLSLRKVAEHLAQAYDLKVNPTTVYRWVRHYSALAAKWMDAQGARTGEAWHMDETVVNVNGQQRYLWNVMDSDTRFLLATHISRTRDMRNTRAPLKKAKAATPDRPKEVRTDGMQSYPYAVGREIGLGKHRRVPSIKAKESNNAIERLHGTEKERTKVMRAFDNDTGAAGIAEGFRVHYNMVRRHQALGVTPAEAAGMDTLDGFKWLALLARAASAEKGCA